MLRSNDSTLTAFNQYVLYVKRSETIGFSPTLRKIVVQSDYGTAAWLMAFSGLTIPANATVPLIAPIAVAINARNVEVDFGDEGLVIPSPGLVLVASSTDDALTKDVSATLDITAYIDEYESRTPASDDTTGDLTTGVASLEVWNDAAGPKTLKRARVKNNAGGDLYAVIYAEDTPDSGSKILMHHLVPAGETVELNFGPKAGFVPIQITDGVISNACIIAGQEDLVAGNVMVGTDFNIEATYG